MVYIEKTGVQNCSGFLQIRSQLLLYESFSTWRRLFKVSYSRGINQYNHIKWVIFALFVKLTIILLSLSDSFR